MLYLTLTLILVILVFYTIYNDGFVLSSRAVKPIDVKKMTGTDRPYDPRTAEMERYVVIERNVTHACNIDWTYPHMWCSTYEEARDQFEDIKKKLSPSDTNSDSFIIRDEENVFCVQTGSEETSMRRYVKIVNLY